jgi:ABC-2 type transport system permease protein
MTGANEERPERTVPSGLASTWTIAGLTWTRLVRGRALWVSLLIAFLPVAYGGAAHRTGTLGVGSELFVFEILVATVLAPMFIASSIGEEIEDRTTTYLWSRPLPRWSIVAGKLVTLVPVVAVVVLASWALAHWVTWDSWPDARSCGALAAGVLVLSVVAAGIASLAPKHGMALAICYLLFFDSPLGVLPATLKQLSVTHQIRALSGLFSTEDGGSAPLLALAIMTVVWSAISAARIRRLEA